MNLLKKKKKSVAIREKNIGKCRIQIIWTCPVVVDTVDNVIRAYACAHIGTVT